MLQENKLEKLIAGVVKSRRLNAPDPDMERIWSGIIRKTRKRNAKKNAARTIVLGAIMLLCISCYTFFNPEPVRAFGNKLWYSFGSILQGHTGTVLMSYTNDLGPNPPQQPRNISPESDLSLGDAAAKCPFQLLAPGYLPSGFTLSQIKYYPENEGFAQVEIYYTSEERWLLFAQWNAENQGVGYSYDTDDTVISDVTVRGNPGKLFFREKNGGYSQLVWAEGERNYRIGGSVSPSEIQRVASSLHELNNN